MTDLPCSGCPRSTAQRQVHLLVTNDLRVRTQNATHLQQQLPPTPFLPPLPQELGPLPKEEETVYMLLSCVLVIRTLCCLVMPTIARQEGYGVASVRGGLSHHGPTCSQTNGNSFSVFIMGDKGYGVGLGSVGSLQP